ncbi:LLM class flavin-dependent oxidoreductase [Actinomadura decatromicini]|uniref:LLM class flavin-dependent oxidoreductase n=1 Tax=Actinomadura decatromicini TaxID=2604572 RepID=A0A5D3FYJ9_9ACTN|nr:LLM class flavin-dependent oxidoreductase [Actinomadura decatromicini]TYK53098.1 LLM class flavin-dependent oxidoreductase [Actinomadura decatromicini]
MELCVVVETQQGSSYEEVSRFARKAEDLGFDGFFCTDHLARLPGVSTGDGSPGPLDCWLTLAALTRETHRIRLGSLMTSATFRPPGLLAVQIAQTAVMSGGRIDVGLGAGWYSAEHHSHAVPFPPTVERFSRLEEQIRILREFFRGTAPFTFEGRHYRLLECPALPRPDRPPVLILGGRGLRRTPALAARYADEFNVPSLSLQDTAERIRLLKDAARAGARDPAEIKLSAMQLACVGATPQEVADRLARSARRLEDLADRSLIGSPAEVAERIAAYGNLGVQRIYLKCLDPTDLSHLELIASAVRPRLRVAVAGETGPGPLSPAGG